MPEIEGYADFVFRAAGGFSHVFEARQTKFNRRVAVKILTTADESSYSRSAFERECKVMGMVAEHPNIVTVFDSGFTADGHPYIAMELYQQTLLDRIRATRFLTVAEVLELGVLLAGALHRAHVEPILHRDIKPQNIFFSQYGDPALGDFGIASLALEPHTNTSAALTEHYAAPEVLEGNTPTVGSDVYSLGATLYTALAGHQPFARPGVKDPPGAVYNRIISEPPPPITSQPVPPAVERELLFTLLAKHPADRPHSALAAGQLLRSLQEQLGLAPTALRLSNLTVDDDVTQARRRDGPKGRPSPAPVPAGSSSPAPSPSLAPSPSPSLAPSPALSLAPSPVALPETLADDATRLKGNRRPGPARAGGPTAPGRTALRPDRRTMVGAGSLLGVLGLVGLGWVALGRDQPAPPTATVDLAPSTSTTMVRNDAPPTRPRQLESTVDGTAVSVSWEAVERAVGYRVDFVVGDAEPQQVDEPMFEFDAAAIPAACVTVRAIDDQSRLGPASEPHCPALGT